MSDLMAITLGPIEQDVYDELSKPNGPVYADEIAKSLGYSLSGTRSALQRLIQKGLVRSVVPKDELATYLKEYRTNANP